MNSHTGIPETSRKRHSRVGSGLIVACMLTGLVILGGIGTVVMFGNVREVVMQYGQTMGIAAVPSSDTSVGEGIPCNKIVSADEIARIMGDDTAYTPAPITFDVPGICTIQFDTPSGVDHRSIELSIIHCKNYAQSGDCVEAYDKARESSREDTVGTAAEHINESQLGIGQKSAYIVSEMPLSGEQTGARTVVLANNDLLITVDAYTYPNFRNDQIKQSVLKLAQLLIDREPQIRTRTSSEWSTDIQKVVSNIFTQ